MPLHDVTMLSYTKSEIIQIQCKEGSYEICIETQEKWESYTSFEHSNEK